MATTTDPTRLAMLARVARGELDHSAAAKELGLTPGVWGLWRARRAKAAGGGKANAAKKEAARKAKAGESARRGRPPGSARRGRPPGKATARASAPTGSLAGVVAQIERLQKFGEELRERVRAMVEMVEGRFPG